MANKFLSTFIRIVLAVTVTFSAPAFSNDKGGGALTATGGGGQKPPIYPPTTYDNGSGGFNLDPNRATGNSFGGDKYRGTAGTFMEVWSVENDGTKVYREGLVDSEGRVRVFKYFKNNPTNEFIMRGYIKVDPTHPDGLRAVFPERWRDRFVNLQKEIMAASQPQPVAEITTKVETKIAKGPTGNLLDGFRATVPGGQQIVYFQGRLDEKGRERVMRPVTKTKSGHVNPQYYHTGILMPDGTVTWGETVPAEKLMAELRANTVNDGRMGWGQAQRELFSQRLKLLADYTVGDWLARMNARTPLEVRLISPHSKYPEIQAPKDPLPKNRSLVLVSGEEAKTVPRTAKVGPNGSLVGITEYLPEMDPQYRPSALNRTKRIFADNQAQREWIRQIRKFARGQRNDLIGNGQAPQPSKIETLKNTSFELGRGVAGFYIAMGIMAGVSLMVDYPNNPVAWQSYIESMTDPAAIAQLGGFMAAAGGTYWAGKTLATKTFGPNAMNKAVIQGPLFMSTLLAGAFAGTIIAEMMADPNTAKCLGHTSYRLIGQFTRDYAACDAMWDKWSSNEHWNNMAVNQLMPMFANIMVAGGLYQAALLGSHYLLSRQYLAVAIRSVRFGFLSAGGFWGKLVQVTSQAVLFLGAYYIADQVFGVGQWVQQFMTAEWSFSNDPNGHSIRDNRDQLFAEWAKLKATNFANPNLITNVCYDSSRKYNTFFSCDDPDRLGPESLILKYGDFQSSWRKIMMQDVENSYNQWRSKSDNFYAMYEVSLDFYKGATERIAFEQSVTDPEQRAQAGFNENYLTNFVERQKEAGSAAWKFFEGKTFQGHWKYVSTYKVEDFLLTSMACGPEVENYGSASDSWWNFAVDYVSGNSAPANLIDNPTGLEVRFFAPRLVKPIDSERNTACESAQLKKINPRQADQAVPARLPITTSSGKYASVFDYVRAEIRPSVMAGSQNKFDTWWEANVVPGVVALENELRGEYAKMLNSEYLTALTKSDYKWCGPTIKNGVELKTGFEGIFAKLSAGQEDCPADATHRLAKGVLNSLRDEMRLYFAMLIDLYVSNPTQLGTRAWPGSKPAAEQESIAKAKEILTLLDQLLSSAKEMDAKKRVNIDELATKFGELSTQSKLDYLLRPDPSGSEAKAPANPHLEKWAYLLGLRIDGVFIEALTLYKILATFER